MLDALLPRVRGVACLVGLMALASACGSTAPSACGPPPPRGPSHPFASDVDLLSEVGARRLRGANRDVAPLPDGASGVQVSTGDGPGVAWLEGSSFDHGSIEAVLCGRDVPQESFIGLAFHRKDDETYEAVYLRPFNFRNDDPVSHGHAVQYIAVPDHDWNVLRQQRPGEFEGPVDASVEPTAWIPVRLDITADRVRVFVGNTTTPSVDVSRLHDVFGGQVGLFTGNGSDGGFANLRLTAPQ